MNIKTMRRDEWVRVLKKKVIIEDLEYNNLKGKISLLTMVEVSSPLYVEYGTKRVKIADKNYSWVQIGFEDEFFWITAMFDENDQLFEIYVDMTDGNNMQTENPYFVDMYLDYVISGDTILEMDRDELEDAWKNGDITQEQYDRTVAEGKKVYVFLQENKQALKGLVQDKLQELKHCMAK